MDQNIAALNILCKGYLAVIGSMDEPKSPIVAQALKVTEFEKLPWKMATDLSSKKGEVAAQEFWAESFDLLTPQGLSQQRLAEFRAELCRELGIKTLNEVPDLKKLVDQIENGQINDETVAAVYLHTKSHLEKS